MLEHVKAHNCKAKSYRATGWGYRKEIKKMLQHFSFSFLEDRKKLFLHDA